LTGTGNNSGYTLPLIEDSWYETGAIRAAGSGSMGTWDYFSVGGFAGQIGGFAEMENNNSDNYNGAKISRYWTKAAEITVNGSPLNMGGFAGSVYATEIADCYSESPLVIPQAGGASNCIGGFIGLTYVRSGQVNSIISCYATANITSAYSAGNFGGLVGFSNGNSTSVDVSISKSYATGHINVKGTYATNSGGLVGRADFGNISECWASGNVEIRGLPGKVGAIYAGGLVGFLQSSAKIENCYALGNVFADDPYSGSSSVIAGGLVGYTTSNATPSVSYSFAKGSVTAQTASASAEVYAGGIIGRLYILYISAR
jgi:hypothetical protein